MEKVQISRECARLARDTVLIRLKEEAAAATPRMDPQHREDLREAERELSVGIDRADAEREARNKA